MRLFVGVLLLAHLAACHPCLAHAPELATGDDGDGVQAQLAHGESATEAGDALVGLGPPRRAHDDGDLLTFGGDGVLQVPEPKGGPIPDPRLYFFRGYRSHTDHTQATAMARITHQLAM